MLDLFRLRPGLPAKSILSVAYYLLLAVSILGGLVLIVEGANDPFGEFVILMGILVLLTVPLTLRVLFGILLKQ